MTTFEIKRFGRGKFDVSKAGWDELKRNHFVLPVMEMFTALDEDDLEMDIARFRNSRDEWLFYNSYKSEWRIAVSLTLKMLEEEYEKLITTERV